MDEERRWHFCQNKWLRWERLRHFRLLKLLYVHNNSYYWVRHRWRCLEWFKGLELQICWKVVEGTKRPEFWSVLISTWRYVYCEEGDSCCVVCFAGSLVEVRSFPKWRVEPRDCPVTFLAGKQLGVTHCTWVLATSVKHVTVPCCSHGTPKKACRLWSFLVSSWALPHAPSVTFPVA